MNIQLQERSQLARHWATAVERLVRGERAESTLVEPLQSYFEWGTAAAGAWQRPEAPALRVEADGRVLCEAGERCSALWAARSYLLPCSAGQQLYVSLDQLVGECLAAPEPADVDATLAQRAQELCVAHGAGGALVQVQVTRCDLSGRPVSGEYLPGLDSVLVVRLEVRDPRLGTIVVGDTWLSKPPFKLTGDIPLHAEVTASPVAGSLEAAVRELDWGDTFLRCPAAAALERNLSGSRGALPDRPLAVSVLMGIPGSRVERVYEELLPVLGEDTDARWAVLTVDSSRGVGELHRDLAAVAAEADACGANVRVLLCVCDFWRPWQVANALDAARPRVFRISSITACIDLQHVFDPVRRAWYPGLPEQLAWSATLVYTNPLDRSILVDGRQRSGIRR